MPVVPLHDGPLWISVGNNRKEKSWKNTNINWSGLVQRLSKHVKTQETHMEYMAFPKDIQAERKDVGGFVGGVINGGRRLSKNIQSRYLLTLDVDYADTSFWNTFQLLYTNAAFIYGTHKHHPDSPRLRLVMPLSREVFPDEYEAIARQVAGTLNIELFDPTTFQPERLMYWGSIPCDMAYYSRFQDGEFIDADEVLGTYKDWHDSSQWPISKKAKTAIHKAAEKQGSPVEKPGVIGAFCRTYDIPGAIAAFLPEVYETTEAEDRYTYTGGSTAGGLVLYDEGMFAFSHHGTDPTSGKLCNAFDLVRLHKFGIQDEDTDPAIPGNKRPSYISMLDFVIKDKTVSKELSIMRLMEAGFDFTAVDESELEWIKDLTKDRKGNILSTIYNGFLIIKNDPFLKDSFAYNQFENREVILKDLPWRNIRRSGEFMKDIDDACLRSYVEKNYNIASANKLADSFQQLMTENAFHPIRDYLNGLTWDSNERLDTLLIDFFGAEDSTYVREVTRKTFIAAVARVFEPGIKFDNVLTLISTEGKGKSTFLSKMGRQWYSDSFGPLDNMARAMEQLQGAWIIEIAELSGLKKSDTETVKHFVSKKEDRFRVAYGKRTEYFPRQCIFIATTNKSDFLQGSDEHRRFWPVLCEVEKPTKSVWADLTPGTINQIWAEALLAYQSKETIYLSAATEREAREAKEAHYEKDPRDEAIAEYLKILIPDDWYELPIAEKWDYLNDKTVQTEKGVKERNKISPLEVWVEVFNGREKDATAWNVKFIREYFERRKDWESRVIWTGEKSQRGFVRRVSPKM